MNSDELLHSYDRFFIASAADNAAVPELKIGREYHGDFEPKYIMIQRCPENFLKNCIRTVDYQAMPELDVWEPFLRRMKQYTSKNKIDLFVHTSPGVVYLPLDEDGYLSGKKIPISVKSYRTPVLNRTPEEMGTTAADNGLIRYAEMSTVNAIGIYALRHVDDNYIDVRATLLDTTNSEHNYAPIRLISPAKGCDVNFETLKARWNVRRR